MTPGAARAPTIMAALAKVCHHRFILANEIMFLIRPRISAPIIAPATPPTPPLIAVPPMTAAVTEDKVSASPMLAFPELVSKVIAIPLNAAIKPEATYVLNLIALTGTAVGKPHRPFHRLRINNDRNAFAGSDTIPVKEWE